MDNEWILKCEECKKLWEIAKLQNETLVKSLTTFHFANQTKAAINAYEQFFNEVQRNGGFK